MAYPDFSILIDSNIVAESKNEKFRGIDTVMHVLTWHPIQVCIEWELLQIFQEIKFRKSIGKHAFLENLETSYWIKNIIACSGIEKRSISCSREDRNLEKIAHQLLDMLQARCSIKCFRSMSTSIMLIEVIFIKRTCRYLQMTHMW